MSTPSAEFTGIYQLRATEYPGYGSVTPTSVHLPCPISKPGIITSASTHQLTNAPLSIGSWLNSTHYMDRLTPGKTYTHLSHLSVFHSYEWKNTWSLLLIEKKHSIFWSCPNCRNNIFKLSESLPTNSIKVLHSTNKIVGWTAFLGSEKVYRENEKYIFSKILQDFGKALCNIWKLTIHLPSKLLYVKQERENLEAIVNINSHKIYYLALMHTERITRRLVIHSSYSTTV